MKINSPHLWPAEWERQAATWIAWPHNLDTWPGRFESIPPAFVKFILTLSQFQSVHVLTGPASVRPTAETFLSKEALSGQAFNRGTSNPQHPIELHQVATNDAWIRDYGPTFVRRRDDGALVGVDWKYNAWGGKYPPYDDDANAAELICRAVGCTRSMSSMYCEGGGLESDGQGTLLTTSSCLLSPTRNPGWTRDMVETELKRQLGVEKIIWVDGGGLLGDDTDGHIDQLARFVSPTVVVAATSSDVSDPNSAGLQANLETLRQSTAADGTPLTVHALPTPPPRLIDDRRVPESYCNFVFVNDGLIVPTFRHEATDQAALKLLGQLLPQRKIVPLDAYDVIWGLGAWHCLSQQQPADQPDGAALMNPVPNAR